MQLIIYALILSFRQRCALNCNDGQQLMQVLRYHAYSKDEDKEAYLATIAKFPKCAPPSKNSRFWANFLIRYAPALLLFHSNAVRNAKPGSHSLR
jgi:hypothetical protein